MSLDPSSSEFKPVVAARLYKCADCENEVILVTNHSTACWPTCKGKCRKIIHPHTARERVLSKQTTHFFVSIAKSNGT
jgi:hypothetical protein